MSLDFSSFAKIWSHLLLTAEQNISAEVPEELLHLCGILEGLSGVERKSFFNTNDLESAHAGEKETCFPEEDVFAFLEEAHRIPFAEGCLINVFRSLKSFVSLIDPFQLESSFSQPSSRIRGMKLYLIMTMLWWAACVLGKLEWAVESCCQTLRLLIRDAHQVSRQSEGEEFLTPRSASLTLERREYSLEVTAERGGAEGKDAEKDKEESTEKEERAFIGIIVSIVHVLFSWSFSVNYLVAEAEACAQKYAIQHRQSSLASKNKPCFSPTTEDVLNVLKDVAKEQDTQWASANSSRIKFLSSSSPKRIEPSPAPVFPERKAFLPSPRSSVSPSPSFFPLSPTIERSDARTESSSTEGTKVEPMLGKKISFAYCGENTVEKDVEGFHCSTVFYDIPKGNSKDFQNPPDISLICTFGARSQCTYFSTKKNMDTPKEEPCALSAVSTTFSECTTSEQPTKCSTSVYCCSSQMASSDVVVSASFLKSTPQNSLSSVSSTEWTPSLAAPGSFVNSSESTVASTQNSLSLPQLTRIPRNTKSAPLPSTSPIPSIEEENRKTRSLLKPARSDFSLACVEKVHLISGKQKISEAGRAFFSPSRKGSSLPRNKTCSSTIVMPQSRKDSSTVTSFNDKTLVCSHFHSLPLHLPLLSPCDGNGKGLLTATEKQLPKRLPPIFKRDSVSIDPRGDVR